LKQAETEAKKTIAEAEAKAAELLKNTQSELKLFARQSVNALKTEITNLICGEIVNQSVKPAIADKAFMQKVILSLVQDWSKNEQLNIQATDAMALKEYFEANAKELLNNGVKISQANNIKTGFAIVAEDKGYKISFGEDELVEYFKEFLRPKLVEMLF
jgi:V/A-type H+-transporting ATPase subunit E